VFLASCCVPSLLAGERRLLDIARINLGAARSALRLPEYKQLCWNDLDGLLAWKSTRQAF
jgi:hypothetical protein